MTPAAPAAPPRAAPLRPGWRRLRFALLLGVGWGLLMSIGPGTPALAWLTRTCSVVLLAVLAYSVFEQWPQRLPRWLARWVWQLVGVVLAIPIAAFIGYSLSTEWPFWSQPKRLQGYGIVTFLGILFGPWIALGAMLRQREALARNQALAFSLERSELERQTLDARLHLMQAQVQPHFLFNTLANVRALVGSGSPQATRLLDSLIAYLRAAVPRLNDPATTLGQELQLVSAYLDLMQMRIPDRLQHTLRVDPAALAQRCPPMTLLTLVENAVRHGIDPSEEGGRIDIDVQLRGGLCQIRVSDTGLGLGDANPGLGTGLTTLRERLNLAFGGRAQLRLSAGSGRGVCAELDLPAEAAPGP
jgi:glucose-6-phosphate-specific signal transduction histidine kinase